MQSINYNLARTKVHDLRQMEGKDLSKGLELARLAQQYECCNMVQKAKISSEN